MRHLSDEELLDALEGSRTPAASAHLRACTACAGRVAEAEAGLALARRGRVPEPSPLYWEAMRRNVAALVDAEPRRAWGLGWLVPIAAAGALTLAVLLRLPARAPVPAASPSAAAALPSWSALPPLDEDEAAPVLEGLVAAAGPAGWDEGEGAAAYVAGLSDDDSAALADALTRAGPKRGEDL